MGNAQDIYQRMEKKSFQMINEIIKKKKDKVLPSKRIWQLFSRRRPHQSNLETIEKPNLKKLYDFIRMLDADGYSKAFISFKTFKILLKQTKINKNTLNGKFEIIKK